MFPQKSPRIIPDRLSTTLDPPGFAVWSLTVIDAPVADSSRSPTPTPTPTTASEGVGGDEMLLLLGRCFGALCRGSTTNNDYSYRAPNSNNTSASATVPPLSALTIRFYAGFRHAPAKASVLKALCTQYIPYVCGLSTLRILYNKQDECEDVSALAVTLGRLTQLTFNGCGLSSIAHRLPNQQCLRILDLSYCQRLASLEGLEGGASCPALEEVRLASTAITSLRALKDCPALVKIDVTYCDALESLEGLEDHMLLEEVNATETAIVSLDGLQGCSNLRTLIIWGCRHLSSLELVDVDSSSSNQKSDEKGSDGSGSHVAPFFSLCRLETLSAGYTAMSSIQALQWCRRLKTLDLSHCEELTGLDGLGAAHGHLEEINVSNTAIRSVRALAACGTYSLRKVILEGCGQLASLDGLGDHPLLEEIDASYTAITTVGETLLGSFSLRKLTLFSCEQLTSLEGLESHVFLEDLNVGSTPITSLRPLCGCAALRRVYLRCCQHLTSLEGLEHHAHLVDLSLSRTAVTSLSALRVDNKSEKVDNKKSEREKRKEEILRGCPALKKLDISHCQHLSSMEGLEDHVLLEDVDVSWTAIASLNGLQGCRGLWRLIALSCKSLTSVQALERCCALKTLNFSGCPLLTSLEGLGAAHGHLEEINVSNTAVSCVRALQECCPSLQKVTTTKPGYLSPSFSMPHHHHFGA